MMPNDSATERHVSSEVALIVWQDPDKQRVPEPGKSLQSPFKPLAESNLHVLMLFAAATESQSSCTVTSTDLPAQVGLGAMAVVLEACKL